MAGWSIDILGDYIFQLVEGVETNVDVDRKFVITSVGKHPRALDTYRRIRLIAKERLLNKDGSLRAASARALEKQYGYVVGNYRAANSPQDYYGIYTPIGIILVNN